MSKVLAPETWLDGRFYAAPITASILRVAKGHDLSTPIPSEEYRRRLSLRLEEVDSRNLRAEFLLAVANGKLPVVDGVISALTESGVDDGVSAFFLARIPGLSD